MVHRTEESPGRDEWYRWGRVEKVDQEKRKKEGEDLLGKIWCARLRIDRRGERQGREKRVVWTGAEHTDGVTIRCSRRAPSSVRRRID
jgi:hypothetical protein